MKRTKEEKPKMPKGPKGPNIFSILTPYRKLIAWLVILTIGANALTLSMPRIIAKAIDAYARHTIELSTFGWEFGLLAFGVFILTYAENILQVFASERVARDLRDKLAAKISRQSYAYVDKTTPSKLLTNLTSDMDGIKLFVAQAVTTMISSIFLILGASTLMILLNWRLGLAVLATIPLLAVVFILMFKRIGTLFMKSREVIDKLNRSINESILGAALVRVLNSQKREKIKFDVANTESRELGIKIVSIFAALIPSMSFISSLGTLIVLLLGGHFVMQGSMTIGDYSAFNGYLAILIFPVIMLGFMGNQIAQASASYSRIAEVLDAEETEKKGTLSAEALKGQVEVKDLTVSFGDKKALDDISFKLSAGTRTAIIGPTAAGKTQLLYALTGLIEPEKGKVLYDGKEVSEYDQESLHTQIGFVFQDSIIFNLSLRENIAFNSDVSEEDLTKAIQTSELGDFVAGLEKGLDTLVSERGTTLSGGQKQRLMLARALALNPKVLLLDDFTARVDSVTEQKILRNVAKNYPGLTLISVTQKISSVEAYESIILLMEGELLAQGTHKELLKISPEYNQIYNSQRSTSHYELRAE